MVDDFSRIGGLASVFLLLAGCGGGGSSGQGSPSPGEPVPPTPVLQPVRLDPQEYPYSVQAGGRLLDFSLSLGIAAASVFDVRQATSGTVTLTDACPSGGSISMELLDNDVSGQLSAGDRIVLRYSDCDDGTLLTNAVMNTDVLAIAENGLQKSVSLRLTIVNLELRADGQVSRASGEVNCEYQSSPTTDHFIVSGARVSIIEDTGEETLDNFSHDLLQDYTTYEYRLSARGNVASAHAGGTFAFATDSVLIGQLGGYPEAGAITLRGAENTAVRLEEGASGDYSSTEVGISEDFDGDGIFEAAGVSLMWLQAFDAELFDSFRSNVELPDDLPRLNNVIGREVTVTEQQSIADIAVDVSRDQLYVSIPWLNEIAVISTSSYQVVDRIGIGARPAGMYMADDGSMLFIALSQGGAVAALNPDSGIFSRIETALENNSSETDKVVGSGANLYVSAIPTAILGNHVNGYYSRIKLSGQNAVERLSPLLVADGLAPMAASKDVRYLYTTSRVDNDIRLNKVDVSRSEVSVEVSRNFSGGGNADLGGLALSPDGAQLVLRSGEVLRTSDFAQIGTVQWSFAAAFSEDGSQLLLMQGGRVVLYDAASLVIRRTFDTSCQIVGSPFSMRVAHVAHRDQWVLVGDKQVCVVSLTDRLNPPGQVGASSPPQQPEPQPLQMTVQNVFTPLQQGGAGVLAAEIDHRRERVYLGGVQDSVPEVMVLSLIDLTTMAAIPLTTATQPIRLSLDATGDRLYVYQMGERSRIDVIDTTARELLAPIVYSNGPLGDTTLGDMKWMGQEKLLLSPVGDSDARVSLATLNVGNGAGIRVGVGEFAPGAQLTVAPDYSSAYVYAGGSIEPILQRIDLRDPVPIVDLQRSSDELAGIRSGKFSADGRSLYFENGRVLNPQTLMLIGFTAEGERWLRIFRQGYKWTTAREYSLRRGVHEKTET